MGLLSKLFNKESDEEFSYDSFKNDEINEVKKTSACEKCYNKQNSLCKGKNFSCEAFRPIDSKNEEQLNDRS